MSKKKYVGVFPENSRVGQKAECRRGRIYCAMGQDMHAMKLSVQISGQGENNDN